MKKELHAEAGALFVVRSARGQLRIAWRSSNAQRKRELMRLVRDNAASTR
jgi:hypothetical protein